MAMTQLSGRPSLLCKTFSLALSKGFGRRNDYGRFLNVSYFMSSGISNVQSSVRHLQTCPLIAADTRYRQS
jgi:hypothetical protein